MTLLKNLSLLLFANFIITDCVFSQPISKVDSLKYKLLYTESDTSKVWVLHDIAFYYIYKNTDTSLYYAQREFDLAKLHNYERGMVRSLNDIGNVFWNTGNFTRALETYLNALKLAEKIDDMEMKALCYSNIGIVYYDLNDSREAINNWSIALKYNTVLGNKAKLLIINTNLGEAYLNINRDSALIYNNAAFALAIQLSNPTYRGRVSLNFGNFHLSLGEYPLANEYFNKSIFILDSVSDYRGLNQAYLAKVKYFKNTNSNPDTIIEYSKKALQIAIIGNYTLGILNSAKELSHIYNDLNKDSTIKYLSILDSKKDSLFGIQKTRELQSISINEKFRQSEIEQERKNNMRAIGITIFLIGVLTFVLIAIKRKVKNKVFATLGIISLLMTFEFINLFIHPYIAKWTHHNLIAMAAIMFGIALMLAPLHHTIEAWIKKQNETHL